MLGPPGSNHGLFVALPHAVAGPRRRVGGIRSRLACVLSGLFGEPVFLLLIELIVVVATIDGIVATLATWDVLVFLVVLPAGSALGALTFFVAARVSEVLGIEVAKQADRTKRYLYTDIRVDDIPAGTFGSGVQEDAGGENQNHLRDDDIEDFPNRPLACSDKGREGAFDSLSLETGPSGRLSRQRRHSASSAARTTKVTAAITATPGTCGFVVCARVDRALGAHLVTRPMAADLRRTA